MGLIVNLDEFSELCGVTAETMRGYIRAVDGNPGWLIERGDRGRGYKIEPQGGLEWWKAKREADDQAEATRQEQLAQLRLELLGPATDDAEALALSGKKRSEEYAAALQRIQLRRVMGELVEVAELEGPAAAAVIELRRQLKLVSHEYAVAAGLTPEDVRPLEGMIERAVNAFVDALPELMRGPSDA